MPVLQTHYDRQQWIRIVTVLCLVLLNTRVLNARPPKIGFLAAESSFQDMGPHNQGAWKTAATQGQATLLLRQRNGSFSESSGRARKLGDFDVVWYHQGDAIERSLMYEGRSLAEIRQFAESGGGVLLSGGALAMVAQFGLETQIRPQRHELGQWRDLAGMIPVEKTHPAFTGLQDDAGIFWLSRGGCRTVADFYWGGPGEGMILAKTPSGPENPLVEYVLGKGRVIVLGWRWPDYADFENPHRSNLTRLTTNLLDYLAERQAWIPFTLRSEYPPAASPDEPGVSAQQWRALRMAIDNLCADFPDRYRDGDVYRGRLQTLRAEHDRLSRTSDSTARVAIETRFEALKHEALLANPLLNFDRLLMIRRRADHLGLPLNFNGNPDIEPTGYDNTLVTLSPVRPDGKLETLYKPQDDRFIGDIDLHYDADRLLLSTPDASGRWGIAELDLGSGLLTPFPLINEPDVHNYDACYLPNGGIIFTSTAPFIGVPCVGGRSKVANLYLQTPDGSIRRLTNDQDHNWCPAVLNNGRILYQRWEYTDIAHAFMRLLFHANPDGTNQTEYYGSNSFWPTAMFFARPIPNHPTKVVTVVGGHHDAPRQGELIIFDPAKGRHEADGAVQRIPGFGKTIEPVVLDGLIGCSWPRFLHPYALSEKYFLVSCKPTKTSLWGVYLVDVFDNFVLLYEATGRAMLEPIPLRKTLRQPVIPEVVEPNQEDATVLLMDVYQGPGLRGVPRGTVKSLRLISYEFTFHDFGGEPDRVGFDGPWDVKRILGTVPVEKDGSAHFHVPANTPVAVQPLDAQGKALALMRSWFTAMPGEVVSCIGCHEPQNCAPPVQSRRMALWRAPSKIKPWYGPMRGFSFAREVQPVLDAYCIQCHHGKPLDTGQTAFDLTARPAETVPSSFQMHFTPSYVALHRFVHTSTLESDAHLLPPRDFHADTSKLIQILRDDHYGVRLDAEAWDRLITWIDLNAPAHGTWQEVVGHIPAKAKLIAPGVARRRELNHRYAGLNEDPEAVYPAVVLPAAVPSEPAPSPIRKVSHIKPQGMSHKAPVIRPQGPKVLPAARLSPRLSSAPQSTSIVFDDGTTLELVRIPSGQFMMGSEQGYANERPAYPVVIDSAFWIGRFEITNQQYACFDPEHDSGLETGEVYQFGDYERGHTLRRPEQPVVRVSWHQAMAFCDWLSNKTGKQFTLPTEAQWEYACRSGRSSPLWYGTLDHDFSDSANLSDATHHTVDYPHVPAAVPPWRPADIRFNDGWRVSAPVGTFQPNPWGLFDMHGNVAEWTRSTYGPYPLSAGNDPYNESGRKTVRGGSWLDRPQRARSAFRMHYEPSQAVHDVGFRVMYEDAPR
ncbi:MAG: SUMF1/EgtB/PvdO family nonheme iron enzyme [Phycisphaerae bacterium]|nr:SUMF1/EgtB/PvdO family nonheme iron enzyme [Phycisphaerae bacterium]